MIQRVDRAQRIYRVRRVNEYGVIRAVRYYTQRKAAQRRADYWRSFGWIVEVHATPVIRFVEVQP